MLKNALMQTPLFAASSGGGSSEPGMAVVVFTGLALVFFILLLLILIVNIEGKIFGAIDKRKAEKEKAEAEKAETAVSAPVPAAPAPAAVPAAPVIDSGVPPEVVAVITAAVDASTGGAYTLRAVSVSKKGRGSWGLAGVIQSTEPF